MGKSSNAPSPDPRMGEAAMLSAETGQQYLRFMQGQADIANRWAGEDRTRSQGVYQPIEDQFIADSVGYDTPERRAAAASEAVADVRQQSAIARAGSERRLTGMGVTPGSGRFAGETRRADAAEGLAAAGAANMARRNVQAQGEARVANVVNMGRGMAVNPATSLGLANGAASSGFSGAQQGYGQQASILGQQHDAQMRAWSADQQASAGIGGALGQLAGAFLFSSSKEVKHDKKKVFGILDAVKDMPVEKWTYNEGEGDGKTHIGPYAEDFAEKTGLGDGKTLSVIDALGVNMGAIKELAMQVDDLASRIPKPAKPRSGQRREMGVAA